MNIQSINIPQDAVAALEKDNIIEAIKIVRQANGLGLKESKEAVERYLEEHQELYQQYTAVQTMNTSGIKMKLLLIFLAISAVIYYLRS